MWHVAFFGNDFETFDGFDVADYVVEEDWTVFLNPGRRVRENSNMTESSVFTMVTRSSVLRLSSVVAFCLRQLRRTRPSGH